MHTPQRAGARAWWMLFAVSVLLGGCESTPMQDEAQRLERERAYATHLAWLGALSHWRARGRMAAKVPDDAMSASMSWEQNADHYELRLSGPFGQGALRIDGGPGAVRLRTADGRTAHATTPEELVSQELGWEVPVSVLQYWILGRPDPGLAVEQMDLNGDGSVQRLLQSGWDVKYLEYGEVSGGFLPRRVEVRGPQVELKLLMTGWTTS